MRVEDGRIIAALRRFEAIAEFLLQDRSGNRRPNQRSSGAACGRATTRRSSMPCSLVGMVVGDQHAIQPADCAASNCSRMSGEVSTSTRVSSAPSAAPHQDGTAAAAVLRIGGIAGAPVARASSPSRGTPPDEPQPRMRDLKRRSRPLHFGEQAEEILRGGGGQFFGADAFQLRQHRGRCAPQRPARWSCPGAAPAPGTAHRFPPAAGPAARF